MEIAPRGEISGQHAGPIGCDSEAAEKPWFSGLPFHLTPCGRPLRSCYSELCPVPCCPTPLAGARSCVRSRAKVEQQDRDGTATVAAASGRAASCAGPTLSRGSREAGFGALYTHAATLDLLQRRSTAATARGRRSAACRASWGRSRRDSGGGRCESRPLSGSCGTRDGPFSWLNRQDTRERPQLDGADRLLARSDGSRLSG